MTVRGKIVNGKVLLNDPKALAEGTEVEVRPLMKTKTAPRRRNQKKKARPRTLAERFANVVGKATGLPPDASINHDHYLYGTPKRK